MAASAFKLYDGAVKHLGRAKINLSGGAFRIALVKTTLASDDTLSSWGSINANEVTSGNGYSSSGKALGNLTWNSAGSGYHWDASDVFWSANGGDIIDIKYAVIIGGSGGTQTICRSKLTSTGTITISAGNRLTLSFNASGIFQLNA